MAAVLGRSLFVVDEVAPRGSSAVVLALHGFPSASWDFAPLWPHLMAAGFRVVAPDLLGFGFSEKPPGHAYSVVEQADLVEELLRTRVEKVRGVHVLAHDYGVSVAQEMLARRRECAHAGDGPRILSVCFLNGGLFPETHRPRLSQRILAAPVVGPWAARWTSRATLARGLREVFGPDSPPDDALLDGLWALLRHNDGVSALPSLLSYMAERRTQRARWVGALVADDARRPPLRLVDGTRDPVSGAAMAARFRELVPRADVVELPHVGHYPHVEDAAAVAAAALPFFQSVPSSRL